MMTAWLVIAMQLLPAPTLPRWRVVGRNAQAEYAVDPQSVQRQGTRVRAAVRLRFLRPPAGAPALGVMRYVYDCRRNTIRSEASDIYNAQGRFVGTIQTPAHELRDVPIGPTSPNAQVRNHLCAGGRR
ncbi:MAG TPA: surface-adhesin E family protein [Allosphingosinicella sp.]|nr:surface-adhesin E family protein [Allosphingosinicella sp.]